MIKIEELICGTDMLSIIFRDTLMKIGQLSTDHIFSTSDIASLKGDIIPKIINPLTQFTDCRIRIKDFNKLNFNIVFLLKEASLRGIERVVEKQQVRDVGKLSFDRKTLLKYSMEIDKNNYEKIQAFVSVNRKLNTDTILNMVESGAAKLKPFSVYRIERTLLELLASYYPNWKGYFKDFLDKAFDSIALEEAKNRERIEKIAGIIESGKYYLSETKGIPRLVDLRNKIIFDLKNAGDNSLSKEDVDKFLLDKANFQIYQAVVRKAESVYYGNFEGESYKIELGQGDSLMITENTEQIRGFTEKKLSFFREKLKPMIYGDVKVEVKSRYDDYAKVYAFYKRRKNEVIDKVIETGEVNELRIVSEILEFEKNDPVYKMYKEPLTVLIKTLESQKVNEMLLKFFKKHSKGGSLISRIFGMFFSSLKESEFQDILNAEKAKAAAVTNQLIGTDSKGGVKNSETPVQSALKILKSSGQINNARLIINSQADDSTKVREILRICRDIGNTNKAHIERTDKNKRDFLNELTKFLRNN